MPSLSKLIPARFARECATEGFVPECSDALTRLASAQSAPAAAAILGTVAAGPAAFIAIYAGAALVSWKLDHKKERDAKERFEVCIRSLQRIEEHLRTCSEVASIDREINDLLLADPVLRERLGDIELGSNAEAVVSVVRDVYADLGIEDSFNDVRIYLSNISDWVVEIRDGTRAIGRKQDEQLANQDEILLRLDKIDQRLKSGSDRTPELTEEDERILVEARDHGDAKAKAQAAIMQRDFAAADLLIEAVTKRAAAELFDALTLKGDRHYYAGEFDAAVEPYEKALELRPDDITARNNTAIAHSRARLGSIEAHCKRAIDIHNGTLDRVADGSAAWAMTQQNLGIAYADLPTGDRAENLKKTISAYQAALTVFTREAHPAGWAATQQNLGIAYWSLPTGDRAENLKKAISAYEAALTVRTREAHPADWAMTQNNLGAAYADLPTGDGAENLWKAISEYEAALTVRTREAHPAAWAATQNNIGAALAILAEQPGQDRCALLARAIAAVKGALTVWTAEAFPREHAGAMGNLGNIRGLYEAAGCGRAFDAIEPAV